MNYGRVSMSICLLYIYMYVCIHVCIFLMKSLNNRTIALPIRLREKNRILYTPVRTGPVLISQQTVSKSCVLNTTNTKCSIIQQVYIICIIAGHHQRGSLFFFFHQRLRLSGFNQICSSTRCAPLGRKYGD